MKLLVVSSAFPPIAGPESSHTKALCEEFARRGVELHLLTSAVRAQDLPASPSYHIHPVIRVWNWWSLPLIIRLAKQIRPQVILLIYIDWIYNFHAAITLLPTLVKWLLPGTSCVTQFENENGRAGNAPVRRKRYHYVKSAAHLLVGSRDESYGTLLRDSDAIITLSERHLDGLARADGVLRSKAVVIPAPSLVTPLPGANSELKAEGRARLKADDDTLVLVFFGYVYPSKGLDILLRGVALLKGRLEGSPRVQLVVLGCIADPDLATKLPRLQAELNLCDDIVWLGYQDDLAASMYLRAADVAVLPFADGVRLNNSSFAVCASHGLPIVTTRGESLELPFRDADNVLLCSPGSAVAIADAVEKLTVSSALRERLCRGSLELADTVFSWERIMGTTLEILQPRDVPRSWRAVMRRPADHNCCPGKLEAAHDREILPR